MFHNIIGTPGDISFGTAPSGTRDNPLTFTERMRIQQGGNVGIGTTNPALQFQVSKAMGSALVSKKYSVDGSTWSIDLSAGNTHQYTCDQTGGPTVYVSNPTPTPLVKGEAVTLIFVQNSSTACTVNWSSATHIHGQWTSCAAGNICVQSFVVSNGGTDLYATALMRSSTGGTP